jgi:two-component SAPR family response regulator
MLLALSSQRESIVIKPDAKFEIKTLGCFSITLNAIPVATYWPDEMGKTLFCSLLSPLDLYFTWDRISRSILGEPETQVSRRHLEENIIRPLKSYLISVLGFNPLITGDENIRIDQQRMNIDALEFYNSAVEGLKMLSFGNHIAALQKLRRARAIYAGSYLPEMDGKIIANTRNYLESLYQKIVAESTRQVAANSVHALTEMMKNQE